MAKKKPTPAIKTAPLAFHIAPTPKMGPIHLVFTEKELQEAARTYDHAGDWLKFPQTGAQTWELPPVFDSSYFHRPIIIAISMNAQADYFVNPNGLRALIVHEANHVVCAYFRSIEEKAPGEEIVSYALQGLCEVLFNELDEYLGKA